MDIDSDIDARLSAAAGQGQRERVEGYLSLLAELLSTKPVPVQALVKFGQHFTTSTTMAMVVGSRVLDALVAALCAGLQLDVDINDNGDKEKWTQLGKQAFGDEEGEEARKAVIEGVLEPDLAGWCEEQTTTLRHALSLIRQKEEDWYGAARALMNIPLESGGRIVTDEDKLAVYIKIVRLLLECGESGHAQTYFSRAQSLIQPSTDHKTQLEFRLSHARLLDYFARFTEAAQKYHEISFDTAIDTDDRAHMLAAAVTTSILAPAGPPRQRMLASLNRDERVQSLPPHLGTMLKKMLLEYIVRPEEVEEFERGLEPHQRAIVEGGGTVLERAIREHNVGACAKVYDNVGFDGLGELLGLDAAAAEATARRMIEQGRLRAWIDQPLGLLYFESRNVHDSADAQGTAGGLGIERTEAPIEPVSWSERWDDRIRATSLKVEALAATIQERGLVA